MALTPQYTGTGSRPRLPSRKREVRYRRGRTNDPALKNTPRALIQPDGFSMEWTSGVKTPSVSPPVVANSAYAGSPGSFQPPGATRPATGSAGNMSGIAAVPATAWTSGQHVICVNNDHVYWNGSAWAIGDAP